MNKVKKMEPDYRFDGKLRAGHMRLCARKLRELCAVPSEEIDPESFRDALLQISDSLDEMSRSIPTDIS